MPTISRKLVVSRFPRRCGQCDGFIPAKTECVRAYGNGMEGDPKYTLYFHKQCPSITEADHAD